MANRTGPEDRIGCTLSCCPLGLLYQQERGLMRNTQDCVHFTCWAGAVVDHNEPLRATKFDRFDPIWVSPMLQSGAERGGLGRNDWQEFCG